MAALDETLEKLLPVVFSDESHVRMAYMLHAISVIYIGPGYFYGHSFLARRQKGTSPR